MGTKMRLSIILTAIVAAAYYALLLMGAFAGPLPARPVPGAVPLSFAFGFGFIIGAVLLTVAYAWWANALKDWP